MPLQFGLTGHSTQAQTQWSMDFGHLFRKLRSHRGIGIKQLAPELGVTYTYLSKLENGGVGPSEEFVSRASEYFHYDRNELLLAAGKVPADVLEILRSHPQDAVKLLRERFGGDIGDGT